MSISLRQYTSLFTHYTELRVQENRSMQAAFVNGSNVRNTRSSSSGVSARVYKQGSWGFSCDSLMDDQSIKRVLQQAQTNAAFLDSKQKKGKDHLPQSSFTTESDLRSGKTGASQKQVVQFLKELDQYIAGRFPQLTSRSLSLNCLEMEKTLVNAHGSFLHSIVPRTHLYLQLAIDEAGQPVELYDVAGGLGQFQDHFTSPTDIEPLVERLYEQLEQKRQGVYAEAGVKQVILDPELAGILAHEAIGHTCEADLVLGGSIAGEYRNKPVASETVTLVDFAHHAFGEQCPMPVYIDDEGTKADDAVLIEQGVLKGYLHNKESALHFGDQPLGNARAYQFSDEPLIRMRNTAILPGSSTLEEMVASIDQGYYLVRPSNGQADSTSEFMFGVVLGYEIVNGKIGRALRDLTISGIAFDVLKSVDMVSKDIIWLSSGMCGKKQLIPTGLGGPALKCKITIGGR